MLIRASLVPLLLACPQSHGEGLRIDGDNQMARLGTAIHDGLARLVATGEMATVQQLAALHGVEDSDELGMLLWRGRKAWEELTAAFPNPQVEQAMTLDIGGGHTLSGHVDLICYIADSGELRVLDWKTGRKQRDFIQQLMSYGLLALQSGVTTITCTVVWLREGTMETVRLTVGQIKTFLADLKLAIKLVGSGTYRVGDHCEHCPRCHACPARTALVRSSIRDIAGIDAGNILSLGDKLPTVYAGVKCAEKACKDFRDALKEAVVAQGQIAAGGKVYEMNRVEKRVVDPIKAWPVMAEHLSEEEFAPAIKISLTSLLDAVAEKAPARGKGKAKQAFSAELEAAGAITLKTEQRLSERTA
jgi:hypothetical protein